MDRRWWLAQELTVPSRQIYLYDVLLVRKHAGEPLHIVSFSVTILLLYCTKFVTSFQKSTLYLFEVCPML